MKKPGLALIALLALFPRPAPGSTVYVESKSYEWEWGSTPGEFQDAPGGGNRTRVWLEAHRAPRLTNAPVPLRKEVFHYFELESPVTVKFAVVAPPRSTSGHDPCFYAWIEWVTKSNFNFDLDDRRFERKAGIARIAIEGQGERKLEIREWHWEKDLKDTELQHIFPWDAAIVARKMIDFHSFRPRVLPENADGPGKHAPY